MIKAISRNLLKADWLGIALHLENKDMCVRLEFKTSPSSELICVSFRSRLAALRLPFSEELSLPLPWSWSNGQTVNDYMSNRYANKAKLKRGTQIGYNYQLFQIDIGWYWGKKLFYELWWDLRCTIDIWLFPPEFWQKSRFLKKVSKLGIKGIFMARQPACPQ